MTASAASIAALEPLARLEDLDEYRVGLAAWLAGQWEEDKWTPFRTRYGVYGQKQKGVQMIRIKIPGGVLAAEWLAPLAEFNRRFCKGDAHITTRQDIQTYFVPLERTAEALELLYTNGITTREAGGSTFRNVTACSLAGSCPRELVDAGKVAEILARSWIRSPLVQHMPRKVKVSVSGCATDCGASAIHDLGFIATELDGRQGFTVFAAGGLGTSPQSAIKLLDFVSEDDLPRVIEAMARLHHRFSDPVNRNASRLKFLVRRFGAETFVELYRQEFDRLAGLPQRSRDKLDWRRPNDDVTVGRTPLGVIRQHDGRFAIVGNPPLGNLSSDQLDGLAAIAKEFGIASLRTTRDQNIVVPNVPEQHKDTVAARVKALGIDVPADGEEALDVISCPGTTTCRIGITSSQNFARAVWQDSQTDPSARGLAVRISGCHNSCGLHHVGDIGFHGLAKKVDGQPAPHYQIHLGGDSRPGGQVALSGPIVLAQHGIDALRLLRQAYAPARAQGESIRSWAERLGKQGLAEILAPLNGSSKNDVFVDWGDDETFKGAPVTGGGDCAAAVASDHVLIDLSQDALHRLDRHLQIGDRAGAAAAGIDALAIGARRLLHRAFQFTKNEDSADHVLTLASAFVTGAPLEALNQARELASATADPAVFRQAVVGFLDLVQAEIAQPV